ncbi:MAG: hypothetical protein JWP46_1176, partial [Modestobacter sp.]|nr:hypothetical protein [Modestobacter sp.]
FTTLSVPVMTRLRQPERQVLDTLVDAGVARSRSEALAWSVRLVGEPDAPGVPLLAGRPPRDGAPAAYVCRGFVCSAPVGDLSALSAAMANRED